MQSRIGATRFETTRWTIVLLVQAGGVEATRALDELCRIYWAPLYAYARRWGRARHDAEDAVQSFFITALRRDLFVAADSEKGRLRNLLLTAFKHHLHDLASARAAECRLPQNAANQVRLHEVEERLLSSKNPMDSPDTFFDREWARAVLAESLLRLETRYHNEKKETLFQVLRPLLTESGDEAALKAAADKLGMSTGSVGVALHRLRKRYREAMHTTIAATVESDEEIEAEFRALARVLADSGV